jgi:hypothetical protein
LGKRIKNKHIKRRRMRGKYKNRDWKEKGDTQKIKNKETKRKWQKTDNERYEQRLKEI